MFLSESDGGYSCQMVLSQMRMITETHQCLTNFYKHGQGRCDTVNMFTHFDRKVMNISLNRGITEMAYQENLETPSVFPKKDTLTSIFIQTRCPILGSR